MTRTEFEPEPGENKERYERLDIAEHQLKTATFLFLNGLDRASAITLAGAAGNILSQLVRNAGKEPFVDYARRVHNHVHGFTPPRTKYGKHIADRLGINVLKHLGPADSDQIEIDLEKCASDAILKSLTDYIKLRGEGEEFVRAMFSWAWQKFGGDHEKFKEQYESIPPNLRK